jgi:hypothetical protein
MERNGIQYTVVEQIRSSGGGWSDLKECAKIGTSPNRMGRFSMHHSICRSLGI